MYTNSSRAVGGNSFRRNKSTDPAKTGSVPALIVILPCCSCGCRRPSRGHPIPEIVVTELLHIAFSNRVQNRNFCHNLQKLSRFFFHEDAFNHKDSEQHLSYGQFTLWPACLWKVVEPVLAKGAQCGKSKSYAQKTANLVHCSGKKMSRSFLSQSLR